MNTTIKLSCILILLTFINAKKPESDTITNKELEHSLARVSDTLYFGKYEVSNVLYCDFLMDLKKKNQTEILKIAQVDTFNWRDPKAYNEPYVVYYYSHPAYNNYPVVNISYEGAEAFCNWLTDKYNNSPKRKFKEVRFRLPTAREWEMAAKANDSLAEYPWGTNSLRNKKGQILCNFIMIANEQVSGDSIHKDIVFGLDHDCADITAPVNSYYPNKLGVYNLSGNVAEMIQEKGIARGGSWKSYGYDVRIESEKKYDKSATDIGFRYVMEVVE